MSKMSFPTALTALFAAWLTAVATEPVERAVDDAQLARLEEQTSNRSADSILELALGYDERGQTTEAINYYKQAAAQGVGAAELRLGWLCESGTGGEQSYPLARFHYERALVLGVSEANLRLGLLYLEGWGTTRDVPAAVKHLQAAANAGYQPAQKILSEMYFAGTGVATDIKLALIWAVKGASTNDPEAQTLVGNIHQKAVRLPQDILSAREWYQLSAEQEHAAGMRAMASTFLRSGADSENSKIGLRWLELASDNGDGAATFYLAGMYLWNPLLREEFGRDAKAESLLIRASQAGEYQAREVLELVLEGRPLAEAFLYVVTVPFEDRYVQRLAVRSLTVEEMASEQSPPIPFKVVTPIYPAALELAHIEGDVTVELIVDKTGRVRVANAIASTHQGFADLAVASILSWRFRPGYKDGRPVNTRVQVPVFFRLSKIQDGQGKLPTEVPAN